MLMIRSFADDQTKRLFHREPARKLPSGLQMVALRKLRMLNNAQSLADLRIPPANRLEKPKGSLEGKYSIRINDQWRLCFLWENGDADEVAIIDHHS